MERMFIAFDHIGPPIGSHDAFVISIEDTLHFLEVKGNAFLDQIFTAPIKMEREYEEHKRLAAGGKPLNEEEKLAERRRRSVQIPVLSFNHFCMSMWLLTHFALATLAFNLYDKDGSGGLQKDEVEDIVRSVYSNSSGGQTHEERPVDIRAQQILDGMDVDGDGNVTKDEVSDSHLR